MHALSGCGMHSPRASNCALTARLCKGQTPSFRVDSIGTCRGEPFFCKFTALLTGTRTRSPLLYCSSDRILSHTSGMLCHPIIARLRPRIRTASGTDHVSHQASHMHSAIAFMHNEHSKSYLRQTCSAWGSTASTSLCMPPGPPQTARWGQMAFVHIDDMMLPRSHHRPSSVEWNAPQCSTLDRLMKLSHVFCLLDARRSLPA